MCIRDSPTACQLVISSQLKPRQASMGRKMDAARLNQNTGFLNRKMCIRDSVKVGKVNIDEQPELAEWFGVMTIPTLILMEQEIGRAHV